MKTFLHTLGFGILDFIARFIVSFVITNVLLYLAGVFLTEDFNPFNWELLTLWWGKLFLVVIEYYMVMKIMGLIHLPHKQTIDLNHNFKDNHPFNTWLIDDSGKSHRKLPYQKRF